MITFSAIFVGTLSFTLFALLLWFIVRKRYRRVWFPLLAIFTVPRTRLPRLRLRQPPLLAFGCFLLAAIAAVLFALRPHSMLPVADSKKQLQLYLFIDFSPSLSAYVSITQYRAFLQNVYTRLRARGTVTVGTSHSPAMQQFVHVRAFAEHLATLTFHRAGLRLAGVLQQQLPHLSGMDRMIIVADRDQHTWANLHWQHLTIPLHHLVVPQLRKRADFNFYVQGVSVAAAPHFTGQRLNLTVAAAGNLAVGRDFSATVYHQRRKIVQTRARFTTGQNRVLLLLTLPHTHKLPEHSELRVQLQTEGGDAVLLDDEFYFKLASFVPQAMIIADLYGERVLDDPLFQLQTALEVLGFKIKRRDHVARLVERHDLLILAFGKNFTVQQHCPVVSTKTPVWLLPQVADFAEHEVCRCYQRLRGRTLGGCSTLAEVLLPDGVKQNKSSIVSHLDNVTLFHLPPYAQRRGLRYAGVPVLIQKLLQQQGLGAMHVLQQWPRPADIFSLATVAVKPVNVPRGESLLQEEAEAVLPPAVQFDLHRARIDLPRYRPEALRWVSVLLAVVLSTAVLEAVGTMLCAHRWKRGAQVS